MRRGARSQEDFRETQRRRDADGGEVRRDELMVEQGFEWIGVKAARKTERMSMRKIFVVKTLRCHRIFSLAGKTA